MTLQNSKKTVNLKCQVEYHCKGVCDKQFHWMRVSCRHCGSHFDFNIDSGEGGIQYDCPNGCPCGITVKMCSNDDYADFKPYMIPVDRMIQLTDAVRNNLEFEKELTHA